MILAIDIGNTTVAVSIINSGKIVMHEKIMTDISEIEVNYLERITRIINSFEISNIEGAIISSVVPLLTDLIKGIIVLEFGIEPLIVNSLTSAGILIKTDEPEKVGSDRIADAVGAVYEYGTPIIIIDMGTATTISIINKDKEFIGGIILPGVRTALNSLIKNTAQLPQIKLGSPPESMIGKNTSESIESGIIYGTASCIDGICERLFEELGYKSKIIATGGNSGKIIPFCKSDIIIDNRLLLKGLNIIFQKHRRDTDA